MRFSHIDLVTMEQAPGVLPSKKLWCKHRKSHSPHNDILYWEPTISKITQHIIQEILKMFCFVVFLIGGSWDSWPLISPFIQHVRQPWSKGLLHGFLMAGILLLRTLKIVEPQRCLTKTWGLDGQSHHSTWKNWAHFVEISYDFVFHSMC